MKYYNLSEGNFKTGKLPENEMWEAFHWLFSDKSVNDSSNSIRTGITRFSSVKWI